MTATIVYDKSVFDVDSVVSDEGRYKFTVKENEGDDDMSAGEDDDADDEMEDKAHS